MSSKVATDAIPITDHGGRAAVEAAVAGEHHHLWAAAIRSVARGRPGMVPAARQAEADEVVQEAIRRALSKADECQPGRSAVAWVMGIVVNVAAERRRRAMRADGTAAVDTADIDCLPARVPDMSVVDRHGPLFDAARARLRPADRDLLDLLRKEDLTSRELARRLGLPSDGAARVARHRAIEAMRAECRRLAAAQGEAVIP